MGFFKELKRRNVIRVGVAYVLIAWVLLQIVDFTLELTDAPTWVLQVFFIAAALGLPVALIVSWIFELTPEGLKRETEVDRSASIATDTGRKLDRTIIAFLVLAVAALLVERTVDRDGRNTPPPAADTATAAEVAPEPEAGEPTQDLPSIAVLPFVNMSPDPEQEYFSDGLAEELLNRLAQREDLRVAARTSAFQFKGQNLDIADIGLQLNVGHVLEGSVRKSGNRLRVTAQLIKADDGFHLWSETYERELDDVFAIQDDISGAITRALEAELGMGTGNELSPATTSLEAYEAYLRGRFFVGKRGGENLRLATEAFRRAVELDPGFDDAWSGLGFTYALLPSYRADRSSRELRDMAVESINRALVLNKENAEAYVTLGRIRGHFDYRFDEARSHFEHARRLAPGSAQVANFYGDFLSIIGDLEGALAEEQRAIRLDPLAAVHRSDLAWLYLNFAQEDKAIEPARQAVQLAPDSIARLDLLILALIRNGQFEEARQRIAFATDELQADPGYVSQWRGVLYYHQGDRAALEALTAERRAGAKANGGEFRRSLTGAFCAAVNDFDCALEELRIAFEEQEYTLSWPYHFWLPEQWSDDPEWLAFWNQPGLKELIDLRRANGFEGRGGIFQGVLQP